MKINKEGYGIIRNSALIFIAIEALLVCATVFLGLIPVFAWLLGIALFGLLVFIIMFFREPERPMLQDDDIVYAPADGTVVVVEQVDETEVLNRKCIQVSVFMSVTNVHVNWFPVSGIVSYFKYHPGKFLVAWHPKSSEENERTTTVVHSGEHDILFRQVAGLVARRIVNYAKVGDVATQNTKFGFIKFGSRIDLFLPLDSEILVKLDQKTVGSQTPIARLKRS